MSGRPKRPYFLAVLTIVALAVRLAAIWLVGGREPASGITYEHGEIAENLVAGRGFSVNFLGSSGPTSQQAPFYPVLLAVIYDLCGVDSATSLLVVQVLQAVAGTLLTLCVVWLARSLLPDWPTLAATAGWLAALYPSHVYLVTHFQVAVWAALVLTALLAWVAWSGGCHTWSKALATGLLSGGLLLIDPILALALPAVAYLSWRRDRDMVVGDGRWTVFGAWAGRMGRLATIAATAALVIAPWLYRNYRVHGELVFVKSTFGYAFWQGNNPVSWGTDKIPKRSDETLRLAHDGSIADQHRAMWDARHETLYIDDVLLKPTGYDQFAGLTEPERSRLLGRQAWDFVQREPARYARLCARRLRYFLLFDETNPKARHRLYRATTVGWLVSAAIGVLVLRPRWRTLAPLLAIFAAVTVFHTLTITSARFRIPIEPLSLIWAAAPYATLFDRFRAAIQSWRQTRREEEEHEAYGPRHALKGPHTPTERRYAKKELRRLLRR
ncbi:MAG TPA: hypothetical protein VHC22_01445 [Pirellulales bacterium]|nr:hypothetical protein [Pirellulales bacterium]